LGLAIASNLVRLMGGAISLRSSLGLGSEFEFSLQLSRGPAKSDPLAAASRLLSGKRVLLAHPLNHRLGVLKEWLAAVEIVGREVRDLAAAQDVADAYDAVLADASLLNTADAERALNHRVTRGNRGGVLVLAKASERQHLAEKVAWDNRLIVVEKPASRDEFLAALCRAVDLWAQLPQEEQPVEGKLVAHAERAQYRILVAEDTPANQKLLFAVLKKRGHHTHIVKNGAEAVEAVRDGQYDLVLMDLQMPVMDGLQATAAIRALPEPANSKVPIIALTAHAMRGDDDRCLAAGMDAYLAKPIDTRKLLQLIDQTALPQAVNSTQ
jgi:CheY-like chemotaxis protein